MIDGLKAGKNVYVEKPLCLKMDELVEIQQLCEEKRCGVMIGFNRRFSPLTPIVKREMGNGKMSMIYRINAGYIPSSSWIQDPKVGGGRILGEVCHFIDLMAYMCGSNPVQVSASVLPDPEGLNDTVNILVDFSNGSTGVVSYYANGPKSLPKEYFEVFSSGKAAILCDFKSCKIYGSSVKTHKLSVQDKGQKEMMQAFFKSLKDGSMPIPLDEIFSVTKATFAVLKSIQQAGAPVRF